MNGEITFDLVVPLEGLDHIEGCYRLSHEDWKVFYFTHWTNGSLWSGDPVIRPDAMWQSGIRGVDAVYPASIRLNKESTMAFLSEILGGVDWTEVVGPDSLALK